MAKRRWELDRKRRDRLAALEPEHAINRIVKRIVIITGETEVREVVYYTWDRPSDWRRKDRLVLR